MNDEGAASETQVGISVIAEPEPTSLERSPTSELPETASPPEPKPPKKPRDTRLRDCFEIYPVDGGFDRIVCRYCTEYTKVLQKFNPTKARKHLTENCRGTDEALIRVLISSTQAARKSLQGGDAASDGVGRAALVPSDAATKKRMLKDHNRKCPVHLTFHTDVDALGLDVTAPIEHGVLIFLLTFPENGPKLSFVVESNTAGAASCIDGFMNTRPEGSWMASMWSSAMDGARTGPHCRWSLYPAALEDGTTRIQMVERLLKTMVVK